jgi:precorrin-3B C17-methyltransferase
MTGWVRIVGLGPGSEAMRTREVCEALAAASDVVGYGPYVDRVALAPGQISHASDNRVELDRARHALELASQGRRVAVVSGGDPGVFAMASAVFEAVEHGPSAWRALDIVVLPGVSAMFAAAARLGAPLGHDFCAISLSDNLKPWETILKRLRGAAEVGLVIALYNARSKARPGQLGTAFDALREVLPGSVPVVFARAVSSPDEAISITTLAEADPALVDMRTLVLIGTEETRLIPREGARPFVYAPRSVGRR